MLPTGSHFYVNQTRYLFHRFVVNTPTCRGPVQLVYAACQLHRGTLRVEYTGKQIFHPATLKVRQAKRVNPESLLGSHSFCLLRRKLECAITVVTGFDISCISSLDGHVHHVIIFCLCRQPRRPSGTRSYYVGSVSVQLYSFLWGVMEHQALPTVYTDKTMSQKGASNPKKHTSV